MKHTQSTMRYAWNASTWDSTAGTVISNHSSCLQGGMTSVQSYKHMGLKGNNKEVGNISTKWVIQKISDMEPQVCKRWLPRDVV